MNPYEVLGVKESDSIEEISRVFRSLAKKYHPDISLDEQQKKERREKFILITEAYNEIKSIKTGKQSTYPIEKGNEDYNYVIINKAKKMIAAKDYNAAIKILRGIEGKAYFDATMLLGEAYFRKKRYHEALKHFKIVYDNKPWDMKPKLKMAYVYEEIGLKNTAKKMYEEILSMDSSNEKALEKLSKLNKKSQFSLSGLFKKG